jgi:hypothetical protein
MEIYKIPACWPSSFVYGISVAGKIKTELLNIDMLIKENQIELKGYLTDQMNTIKIDKNLLDFIFQFCQVKNFHFLNIFYLYLS